MPKLQDTRKTLELTLKSIEGSKITLKDGLLAGDMSFVYGDEATNDVERGLRALSKMIIKWNLTDDENKPIPATLENIRRLTILDIEELLAKTSYGEKAESLGKKKEGLTS